MFFENSGICQLHPHGEGSVSVILSYLDVLWCSLVLHVRNQQEWAAVGKRVLGAGTQDQQRQWYHQQEPIPTMLSDVRIQTTRGPHPQEGCGIILKALSLQSQREQRLSPLSVLLHTLQMLL